MKVSKRTVCLNKDYFHQQFSPYRIMNLQDKSKHFMSIYTCIQQHQSATEVQRYILIIFKMKLYLIVDVLPALLKQL